MSPTAIAKPYSGLEPAFINLQPSTVMVPMPDKRNISIQPWRNRNRGQEGCFVVRGQHYAQFVTGSAGPLYVFGGDLRWLELPGCAQGRGVEPGEAFPEHRACEIVVEPRHVDSPVASAAAKTTPGRFTGSGTVVGADGQPKVDSWADTCAQLRLQLIDVGIATRQAFDQAPAAVLLSCPHINEKNLARVREASELIFTPPPAPSPPVATEVEPEPESEPELVEDAAEGGEQPLKTYARSAVEKMTKKVMVKVLQEGEFEFNGRDNATDLRAHLFACLADYDMLTEE